MKKEQWLICYHHSFYADVVEGTFSDAVRAGIQRVEEDFNGNPLVVITTRGVPGTENYQEEKLSFDSPLDVISEIERYIPEEDEEE